MFNKYIYFIPGLKSIFTLLSIFIWIILFITTKNIVFTIALLPLFLAILVIIFVYISKDPRFGFLWGKTIVKGTNKKKQLSLTFDDGPSPLNTVPILDLLEIEKVKATFFLIGKWSKVYPDIVKDIINGGHTIGVHSWNHPALALCNSSTIYKELNETKNILKNISGVEVKYFRPCFGIQDHRVISIAKDIGLVSVLWSAIGFDWKATNPEFIIKNIKKNIHPGTIILLHDGNDKDCNVSRINTIEALRQLIPWLKREGYTFVSIQEMENTI